MLVVVLPVSVTPVPAKSAELFSEPSEVHRRRGWTLLIHEG